MAESEDNNLNQIRIKLRGYDHKVVDDSAEQIVETATRYGSEISGPTPLPTDIKRYTVNRSTFGTNQAKEQYEVRVHKRIIDIMDANQKVLDALRNLTLPNGVNIEVKM